MTSYRWARLPEGLHELPGPAVMLSPWILDARIDDPISEGFGRVRTPGQWAVLRTAPNLVADFHDPDELLLICGDPLAAAGVDPEVPVLPHLQRGAGWSVAGLLGGSNPQSFYDQVHERGRLLVVTGDLAAHWSATTTQPLSFRTMFGTEGWAAWVPLLVHLYDTGVGTRAP